jgi:2-dehydropantoate 2-reductase
MSEAGLETQFTPDIKKYEWEKVILNAALSAVCALARKPMKDMMDFELTELLVEELLREGIAVAEACGVTFDEGFLKHCVQYLKKAGYHKTSMHQDIERGTPTEIDWLNGKIVERGRALGVKTPYNFAITALVKGLEMKSGAPEQDQ